MQSITSAPHDRFQTKASARRFAKTLTYVSFAAFAWALVYPRPYPLVIAVLAALPLVALAAILRSKGLYNIEGRRNDSRPSLALPLILSGAILDLRTLQDVHLLHWQSLLAPAAIVAPAMMFALARADWGKHKPTALTLALFAIFFFLSYGCGVVAQADTLLDPSSPERYQTTVLDKRASRGSKSTTYQLRLGPWGPRPNPEFVAVPHWQYNSFTRNDAVCIDLRRGALGIAWYQLFRCQKTAGDEPSSR